MKIKDLDFLEDVIEDSTSLLSIDSSRIYMAGFSNGGMLTHQFALQRPGRLAAAAVVAGPINSARGKAPAVPDFADKAVALPILLMHGTADPVIPYAGGYYKGNPNSLFFSSVQDAVDLWTGINLAA